MPAYKYKTIKGDKWFFSCYVEGKKKKRTGFDTKKAALQAEREFIAIYKSDKGKISFISIYERFCQKYQNDVKLSTYYGGKKKMDKYILSYFKSIEDISKINYDLIEQWKMDFGKKELSTAHKNSVIGKLKEIFDYTIKLELLAKNPTLLLTSFKKDETEPTKDKQFFVEEEALKFLSTFDENSLMWLFFASLYYCGIRSGELRAIKGKDHNYEKRTLSVYATVTQQRNNEGLEIITTPKSKSSVREVLLPDFLNDKFQKLKTGSKNFIFGIKDRPYPMHTLTRIKNKHCKLAGVKQIRLHDFRHSHASYLINHGASPLLVAKRFGHSRVSTTLDTYSHLFPNEQEFLIDLIANPIKK